MSIPMRQAFVEDWTGLAVMKTEGSMADGVCIIFVSENQHEGTPAADFTCLRRGIGLDHP